MRDSNVAGHVLAVALVVRGHRARELCGVRAGGDKRRRARGFRGIGARRERRVPGGEVIHPILQKQRRGGQEPRELGRFRVCHFDLGGDRRGGGERDAVLANLDRLTRIIADAGTVIVPRGTRSDDGDLSHNLRDLRRVVAHGELNRRGTFNGGVDATAETLLGVFVVFARLQGLALHGGA